MKSLAFKITISTISNTGFKSKINFEYNKNISNFRHFKTTSNTYLKLLGLIIYFIVSLVS